MNIRTVKILLPVLTVVIIALFLYTPQIDARDGWSECFPLRVGNTWVYQTTSDTGNSVDFTVKVTGTRNYRGAECFIYEAFKENDSRMQEYFEISNKGLVAHKRILGKKKTVVELNPQQCVMSFPLDPGKTWTWKGKIDDSVRSSMVFRVEGIETVVVPAGTFRAYRISIDGTRTDNTRFVSQRWYSRNVGMVKEKSRVITPDSDRAITAVLKSYILITGPGG